MKQTRNIAAATLRAIAGALRGGPAFCNIAEGTHAGSVTMKAAEAVDSQNLLVAAGENDGEFVIASASKKPIGVCLDEGAKGESVSVALPGCAESTFVCRTSANVSAGDSLYTSAGGKVSPVAGDGAYKVGVALCSAAAGCPLKSTRRASASAPGRCTPAGCTPGPARLRPKPSPRSDSGRAT